jgi:hypothetical protein
MQDALCRIHTFNDDCLLGQASNKAKPNAYVLRTESVKKRKVDEETNAETWTLSIKRREINA